VAGGGRRGVCWETGGGRGRGGGGFRGTRGGGGGRGDRKRPHPRSTCRCRGRPGRTAGGPAPPSTRRGQRRGCRCRIPRAVCSTGRCHAGRARRRRSGGSPAPP